jgi:hypothetical protein
VVDPPPQAQATSNDAPPPGNANNQQTPVHPPTQTPSTIDPVAPGPTTAVFTVGDSTLTASQSTQGATAIVVDSATLAVGSSILSTNGQTPTLATSGLMIVQSGTLARWPSLMLPILHLRQPAVVQVSDNSITVSQDSPGANTTFIDGVTLLMW